METDRKVSIAVAGSVDFNGNVTLSFGRAILTGCNKAFGETVTSSLRLLNLFCWLVKNRLLLNYRAIAAFGIVNSPP